MTQDSYELELVLNKQDNFVLERTTKYLWASEKARRFVGIPDYRVFASRRNDEQETERAFSEI